MVRLLLVAFWLLATPLLFANSQHYFDGLDAFEKKDYTAAKSAFETAIEKDQVISSDILFNLGNTLFRLGDLGTAALWYERALLLNPNDAAAQQNLRLLQHRTGALVFEDTLAPRIASWLKHSHWLWFFSAAIWMVALSLAVLFFLNPGRRTKSWIWFCCTLALLAAVGSAIGVWGRLPIHTISQRAIITQPGAVALASPTETAGVIIDLPAGSEISVQESRESWSYIEIPGTPKRVGWVRNQHLNPLWPYSSTLIE